jgi:hypothetical protein
MSDGDDLAVASDHRSLGGIFPGHEHARDGARPSVGGHGQHAAHWADATVQGQLAHEERVLIHLRGDRARGRQDADGDGNVEGCPVLAQIRRRQIHRDATERVLETAVFDGAANADASLHDAGIRQAHDVAARQPIRHVHLDVDGRGFDADDGCGKNVSKHMAE